jgi:quercetin dioxygenase-like cupin family protein
MILKSANFSLRFLLIVSLASLFACVSGPHLYLQYGDEYQELNLDKILADNPLPASENIKVVNLGRSQSASQHIVQIRDREVPHLHKLHDATVTILRGQGYLILANNRINLKAGDIVHIPRGIPHYYVNTAGEPTVALAVYSPAFDGKDTHPVKPS